VLEGTRSRITGSGSSSNMAIQLLNLQVPILGIFHMRVMSFVAVVAPRTGKIIKNGLVKSLKMASVFLKEFFYKMVYFSLCSR